MNGIWPAGCGVRLAAAGIAIGIRLAVRLAPPQSLPGASLPAISCVPLCLVQSAATFILLWHSFSVFANS